jgi:hypothetical protein
MKSGKQLCDLLGKFRFEILSAETIRDASRASHIPVEYIKAAKVFSFSACGLYG